MTHDEAIRFLVYLRVGFVLQRTAKADCVGQQGLAAPPDGLLSDTTSAAMASDEPPRTGDT